MILKTHPRPQHKKFDIIGEDMGELISIGTDKEGNEITLIVILGSETDDVIKEVDLKIEKSKIYRNLDILDDREKEVVVEWFGLILVGRRERSGRLPKSWGSRGVMCLGLRKGR